MNDTHTQVLVVDDEQIVLDSVAKHLKQEPVELHLVLHVDEALKVLESHAIDIVLTDLMMPDTDGLEFMKLVKDHNPRIPVIMITGYATVNTALQATQLGAFDYIAKPFSKKELLGVVRRALDLVAETPPEAESEGKPSHYIETRAFKTIGHQSWLMLQDDGLVIMGVEHSFLRSIGRIQTIYLPEEGDELRQGGTYLKIFSTDLRSHSILSPLTGVVVETNERVLEHPNSTLEDPYGDGWLIKLRPTRFEQEVKLLGLG